MNIDEDGLIYNTSIRFGEYELWATIYTTSADDDKDYLNGKLWWAWQFAIYKTELPLKTVAHTPFKYLTFEKRNDFTIDEIEEKLLEWAHQKIKLQ